MKKLFIILLLFLGIPTLADENKAVLPSETGIVESIKYEDAEYLNQGESTTKQLVTVKVLTGNFKGYKTPNWKYANRKSGLWHKLNQR